MTRTTSRCWWKRCTWNRGWLAEDFNGKASEQTTVSSYGHLILTKKIRLLQWSDTLNHFVLFQLFILSQYLFTEFHTYWRYFSLFSYHFISNEWHSHSISTIGVSSTPFKIEIHHFCYCQECSFWYFLG